MPFEAAMLPGAARLLAQRHRLERRAEPALGPDFEDPATAEAYLRNALQEDAEGVAEVDGSEVRGYLLAVTEDHDGARRVWSSIGWQGAAETGARDTLSSLYAASAERWVAEGVAHHLCVVPGHHPRDLHIWSHLGFAHQQIYAIAETRPRARNYPFTVRRAAPADIDLLAPALGLIARAHRAAPVFAYVPSSFDENLRPGHLEALGDERAGYFLACEGETLLGFSLAMPVGEDISPLVPQGAVSHVAAATLPAARGRGVQRALTDAVLDWAYDNGHTTCVTDWRAANPDSSRVWPRLGFRPSGYRLHRMIDPRVMAARGV